VSHALLSLRVRSAGGGLLAWACVCVLADGTRCQVDKDDLYRALQRTRQMLSDFIRDEAHRSILIHNRAEGLTVWLAAPHGADINNSFSFTKKELKCDPKQSLPPAASTHTPALSCIPKTHAVIPPRALSLAAPCLLR